MTLTISVTQDDIDRGVAADCRDCPVARAIYRVLEKPVTVGAMSWAIVDRELGFMERPLPQEAIDFIGEYDGVRHHEARPFTFTLTIPDTDPAAVRLKEVAAL